MNTRIGPAVRDALHIVTKLEEVIRREIGEDGAISFARFMELALYYPNHGYYERHLKQTGRDGDFFTSVSVGSLYGELLGVDFARLLKKLRGEAQLIEAGAHDGQLAREQAWPDGCGL